MSGNYRIINYSLRPAKTIERKMMCDAFRRLYPFGKIETYRYVGFGSIYFSDFQLFHRVLGIDDMLSIEKDAYAEECFEFNKPYKCVRIDCRPASDVLPGLDWQSKTIAWLDYESKLDEIVLSDVVSVCAKACSGSVLVVSLNAHPDSDPDEATRKKYIEDTGLTFSVDAYRLREMRNRLGDNLPSEVSGSELRGGGVASISRKVIHSRLEEALSIRNGVLPSGKKLVNRQIFNFQYNDNARMLTVGWIFYEADDHYKFDACLFNELDFVRLEEEPYMIKVPCLTLTEMRHLNSQLPRVGTDELAMPGVPPSHIKHYTELYRYFPTFTEAIYT